jgi:hypothetical protein
MRSGQAASSTGSACALSSHLLATLDYERRFDPGEWAQFGGGLRAIALVPLSLPVLESDRAIRMRNARDQMLLLLPNRAPHRHIIQATLQQPGHRLVLLEPTQRLAHRRERLLHFLWLTHTIGRLAATEPMRP